jgi:VWFA-related protein
VVFVVAVCSAPDLSLSAQQPPGAVPRLQPTFRVSTRLVVHTVRVTDRDGNPVEGLTPQDFVVTENDLPQEVAFAVYQRIPTDLAPVLDVALTPDAAPLAPVDTVPSPVQTQILTPPAGDARYQDKRLLVLYFDLYALGDADRIRAFLDAQKYIDTKMTAADLIAIMTFQDGAVRVRNDFTADRAALRETLVRLLYNDDLDGDGVPDNPEGTPFGQDDGEFNLFSTDRRLAAIQTAVTMLRPLPEQKVLLYFASGLRLNGTDNQAQLRATINAALKANVTINPIDARGLVAFAPLGDASRASPGPGIFSGQMAFTMMTGFQQSQDTLYALAKDTGGKALLDYNDLTAGIVQAADAVTSYYIIGYYSTNTTTDGRFRRIKISLAGNRDAEVAYRPGYYAEKTFANFSGADKERQLQEALMLEDPITDVTIAMELNFFQLNSAEYFVPVAVKIPGSELAIVRRRGAARTEIDFIGVVKDEFGFTVQNIRDRLPIRLTEETANQLATRPIQYDTGFTVLPGKYVLKVLTRDAETGRIGTFQGEFRIPNLLKEETRLPISSVVLSSQRVALGDALFTVDQKVDGHSTSPLVHNGQKLIPSVTRVFSQSRDMYVYLQAYEHGAEAMRPLAAFVAFYQGDVKTFQTAPVPVVGGMYGRSKAVPIMISVPLADLPPGRYECQVTVLDPETQKIAFWRAPIVVVE